MNKKEFIKLFAQKGEYTRKEAEKSVTLFLELIEEKLIEGESISFIGWGKFETVTRTARTLINPQTKKKMKVKAKKVVRFRAGKTLKNKIM